MRIVGGALSGRRFAGPPGDQTRPTSERVREALASALVSREAIAEANVLDLYAGTGALAFEALSRGAHHATLIEKNNRVASALRKSARELGIDKRVTVLCAEITAPRLGPLGTFDLIFADPPYADLDRASGALSAIARHLTEDAYLVFEHAKRDAAPYLPGLVIEQEYRYGDTAVALYQLDKEDHHLDLGMP